MGQIRGRAMRISLLPRVTRNTLFDVLSGLLVVLLVLAGAVSAHATAATRPWIYVHDVSADERVYVHAFETAEASPT